MKNILSFLVSLGFSPDGLILLLLFAFLVYFYIKFELSNEKNNHARKDLGKEINHLKEGLGKDIAHIKENLANHITDTNKKIDKLDSKIEKTTDKLEAGQAKIEKTTDKLEAGQAKLSEDMAEIKQLLSKN